MGLYVQRQFTQDQNKSKENDDKKNPIKYGNLTMYEFLCVTCN